MVNLNLKKKSEPASLQYSKDRTLPTVLPVLLGYCTQLLTVLKNRNKCSKITELSSLINWCVSVWFVAVFHSGQGEEDIEGYMLPEEPETEIYQSR